MTEHVNYPGIESHWWRSAAGGNFGAYGWRFGVSYIPDRTDPHVRESFIVLSFGPWRWQFKKTQRIAD